MFIPERLLMLNPDRCFDPEPSQRTLARGLYGTVERLPLICPHGHVSPSVLQDNRPFGSPAELFVIPDHYVHRLLYSQGVPLERLGIGRLGSQGSNVDHRQVWRVFCTHFHLFRGTPTGLWLRDELETVFGISEKPCAANADALFDALESQLARPELLPRALFRRFNISVLCTTDAATDSLEPHIALQSEGFAVRPTFRPDRLLELHNTDWRSELAQLEQLTATSVTDYRSFIAVLERRREQFKMAGATATDHGVTQPWTARLSPSECETILARALTGSASAVDTDRFTAQMLLEFARMSCEDGLVMQLHAGSLRNHNTLLQTHFGTNIGADIPVAVDWTRGLQALLDAYGNDSRLRLILFTLDESTYSRELAPLVGHYPSLRLGPPWWFMDSVHGIERYLDAVLETAGMCNLAGFNDDTRAFASIPARHDLWRRVSCNWLAKQQLMGLIDEGDALEMALDFAQRLAIDSYRLESSRPELHRPESHRPESHRPDSYRPEEKP
jgi:glucuronate isomerase